MTHHSDSLDKLAPALVALQADLRPVSKGADNPFFKSRYAPLPDVSAALQPLLAKNDLALTVFPAIVDGGNGLRFLLLHSSGQFISGEWLLTPVKRDPQGEGSDTTYKRRYGLMSITGLVADEDDDGNAAVRVSRDQPSASALRALGQAKDRLREAVKLSGAPASEFAWVAKATPDDADRIHHIATALEVLRAGEALPESADA